MPKLKIVVTGGAGFIGSHIVEHWVKEGADVHVIDNLRTGFLRNIEEFPGVNFHNGSVTDKELVDKVIAGADYIHHLAALVSVPESVEKSQECIEINIFGLLNVLEAARKNKVKKIVFSSSAAVYGDDPELPKNIHMKPAPKSPYGITKLDGEYYLNMYNEMYSLGAVSLRYFNVFGPKQSPTNQYAAAIPIFINNALKNKPLTIYGDGEQTRDFIFVKDVVNANILAATNPEVNGVFNIGQGTVTSIKQLAEEIIQRAASSSKIVYENERVGDIKHSFASINETIDKLKFGPKYSLKEGLLQTIDYFKTIN